MYAIRSYYDILFDENTFEELDAFVRSKTDGDKPGAYGDGVIVGHGRVNGRKVFVYAQDFNFMGGSLGEAHRNNFV